MKLNRIYGEFDSDSLAELAAGRIRRAVRGIRRMTICRLSGAAHPIGGRVRFTMLPANPRMMNYATDVLWSEYVPSVPEPMLRQECELMIVCDANVRGRVESLLHAAGAMRVRSS